jgi:hypothetical protein
MKLVITSLLLIGIVGCISAPAPSAPAYNPPPAPVPAPVSIVESEEVAEPIITKREDIQAKRERWKRVSDLADECEKSCQTHYNNWRYDECMNQCLNTYLSYEDQLNLFFDIGEAYGEQMNDLVGFVKKVYAPENMKIIKERLNGR